MVKKKVDGSVTSGEEDLTLREQLAGAEYRTQAELEEEIAALSNVDLAKLRVIAVQFQRPSMPAEDILHEAVARVLEGRRRCRRKIPVLVFLCGVMRSIGSSRNEASDLTYQDAEMFEDIYQSIWSGEPPTPEQVALSNTYDRRKLSEIAKRVANNELLQRLIEAREQGLKGKRIYQFLGVSRRQFQALAKQLKYRTRDLKD